MPLFYYYLKASICFNATAVYRSFTFFTVFSSHPKDGCLLDVHKT
jgi:hypothetical protein